MIMMYPTFARRNSWLPTVFNDFFDTDFMPKANATKMQNKQEQKEEDKNTRYLRREFSYSQYEQTLILPEDVDKDKIAARVSDGVLTVDLPKIVKEEIKVARQINVG